MLLVLFVALLPIEPWTILELMVHGTRSEARTRYCPTLRNVMVLATMRTNHLSRSISVLPLNMLVLSLFLVLLGSLLMALLVSLSHSLNLKGLVVQILKFISSPDGLFKGSWWYNSRCILLSDRVKSLKELCYLLLHSVD